MKQRKRKGVKVREKKLIMTSKSKRKKIDYDELSKWEFLYVRVPSN
jgi:hypothetical protein